MPKKTSSVETLSSYWCPPTSVQVGKAVACIASTFEFDAAFYETELLPRFLGLKFDQTENERTFLIEREENLELISAAVLVDIHKIDPGQTTLQWDQIPIAVPGAQAIQHSKVVLLVWENLVRLIVGSANLNRSGYRRNREVFAALDFYDDRESVPRQPVDEAIVLLEELLAWARIPDATRLRIASVLTDVRKRNSGWQAMPREFRPREKPRVAFVVTSPAIQGKKARSTLDQISEAWGPRRATEITVITPFVGKPSNADDAVVQRLAEIPRSRDCIGWLVAPRRPAEEADEAVHVPIHKQFGEAWRNAFSNRGGARVLALPQFVKGIDTSNRSLHSKAVSLEDGSHQLLMVGSSNFTSHGMGIGVYNVEANLLFEFDGVAGWDNVELPISWNDWQEVDAVQWDEHYELPEDAVDGASTLPAFFACASYSQVTGVLKLELDPSFPEPSQWSVRLIGSDSASILFDAHTLKSDDVVKCVFPEAARSATLCALAVEWIDSLGDAQAARLIVSVENKDDLVPSELFKGISVDTLLERLIRRQGLAGGEDDDTNRRKKVTTIGAGLDSLRSVDTSSFLLYQVRRFGRAMNGLRERLERVATLPTAIRYRLFKDPLGPISLAEGLLSATEPQKNSISALPKEHRLFLLAELLLEVTNFACQMVAKVDSNNQDWLKALLCEAIESMAVRVATQQELVGGELPENLQRYSDNVRKVATAFASGVSTEVLNAS